MHSSGSITSIRAISWMQSTGHTSMHDLSLTSMQGSAMMYVTWASSISLSWAGTLPNQLADELRQPLRQHRPRHHRRKARGPGGAQPLRVGVLAEAEHRD